MGQVFGRAEPPAVPPSDIEEGEQLIPQAAAHNPPSWWTSSQELCVGNLSQCWSDSKNLLWTFKDVIVSCWGAVWDGGCFGCWPQVMGCCSACCPLSKLWGFSDKAMADALDTVTSIAVMGIFSLNMYCASYFLAWAPSTVNCFPDSDVSPGLSATVMKWVKVIVSGLPFTLFPMTLYVAGQAKALQRDIRGLGLVAGGVILEIVYVLCLGALMTVCTEGSHLVPVSIVTIILIFLLLLFWGCCCEYPMCLRCCCSCCCSCCRTQAPPQVSQAPVQASVLALTQAADAARVVAHAMEMAAVALEPPPHIQIQH